MAPTQPQQQQLRAPSPDRPVDVTNTDKLEIHIEEPPEKKCCVGHGTTTTTMTDQALLAQGVRTQAILAQQVL